MADFQEHADRLDRLEIDVYALSTDEEEEARGMVQDEGLEFPVGYGLDARDVHERTGARIDEEEGYIHATGFLIRPDGTVQIAVYSNGPAGRLSAEETIGLIKYYRSQEDS